MAESGVFYIKVIKGDNEGEIIPLQGDVVSLGAGKDLSVTDERISLQDDAMSGEHAVFMWQKKDNTYMISNRSPINPISVNGSPCGHALLAPGMRISLGQTELEIVADNYSGPSEAVIAPAVLPRANDLYLGEQPEETENTVGTPAWLLNSASHAAVGSRIADMTSKGRSLGAEEPEETTVARPAYAPAKTAASQPAPAEEPRQEELAAAEAEEIKPEAPPVVLGRIQVIKGANRGKHIDVCGNIKIGRSPDCDLTLSDAQISREHCTITFEDGEVYITNLSSSNTTKVGRTNVKRAKLQKNADIMLASRVQLKWTAAEQ